MTTLDRHIVYSVFIQIKLIKFLISIQITCFILILKPR